MIKYCKSGNVIFCAFQAKFIWRENLKKKSECILYMCASKIAPNKAIKFAPKLVTTFTVLYIGHGCIPWKTLERSLRLNV